MVPGEASLGADGPASLGESSRWAGQWKDGSTLIGRAKLSFLHSFSRDWPYSQHGQAKSWHPEATGTSWGLWHMVPSASCY